jgi:thiol-disulfide isomerase/thioredoxin
VTFSLSEKTHAQNLAVEFQGPTLAGEEFRLSDVIGQKMIVLNFFATWCGPCIDEMPLFEKFQSEHKNKVLIVGIDGDENPDKVKSFVKNHKLTFPVLVDSGHLKRAYKVNSFPETLVIGLDGKIQHHTVGPANIIETLGFLLKKNQDSSGQRISKLEFLKNQKEVVQVVAPQMKPVEGYDKSKKNEIFSIKKINETPQSLELEVGYFYSGDQGEGKIAIDCYAKSLAGPLSLASRPASVKVGHNKAITQLMTYSETADGAITTEIFCDMNSRWDSSTLSKQKVWILKRWKK